MKGRGIKFKGIVQRMNPTRFCGGIPAHQKYGFCNTERSGKLIDHTYADTQRNFKELRRRNPQSELSSTSPVYG